MKTNRCEAVRSWFDSIVKLLVAAAVIVGGLVTYKEYAARQSEARIERTMKYLEEFEEGTTGTARAANRKLWKALYDPWSRFLSAPGASAAQARIRHQMLIDQLKAIGVSYDGRSIELADDPMGIETIVAFYQRLGACIDAGLCDMVVASQFFSDYGANFLGLHYPYILERRETFNETFASSLQQLYGLAPFWADLYEEAGQSEGDAK